jgi:signal transduction histidine kinase/ActR/RegA family two-component response regulator
MSKDPTAFQSFSQRYGLALAAVLLAAVIRFALSPWMPQGGVPFITFFLAVMLAAWVGGMGPGLFASVLSALVADFLYIEPAYQIKIKSTYMVSLGVFCLETVAISLLAEKSKRTEAKLREKESDLEARVKERTQDLLASQMQLRNLATELNLAEQRERGRLAEALHDHLQQTLVLGKLKIGQGQHLAQTFPAGAEFMKQMDEIFSEALDYTRTLVTELSPTVLREHGFAAGLQWLAQYMRKHDLIVTVEDATRDNLNLPENQSVLLFQSVRELLINAAKHSGTEKATVTLTHQDSRLRIGVHDKGKGFNPDAVKTGTAGEGGTNRIPALKFGLFSIGERMKALGGDFELESAPGKGTTALLTLPLKKTHVKGAAHQHNFSELPHQPIKDSNVLLVSPAKNAAPDQQKVVRLLLVDDHAMVRQGLRTILEVDADIQVISEASDGQEAVKLTEQLNPSVVIMDINMPKMNGIEATAIIKSRHPDTVVIGLSVNASDENQKAMKLAGASMLLTKEAAVGNLYTAIHEALKAKA